MAGFSTLGLCPSLCAVVAELGFEHPTPIQTQAIPPLLAGKDVLGHAKTGSGKTAAFALPILQRIELGDRTLQALVMCPTRELSAQVAAEIRRLGRKLEGLTVRTLTGGEPVRAQTEALARGVHIAVGTPGRILDHVGRGNLVATSLQTLVLDEADRMLDMGFEEDMNKVLAALPVARQTALFSATFPDGIEAIRRAHQRNAVRLTVGAPAQMTSELQQFALLTQSEEQKPAALGWLFDQYLNDSALVFCNFKATVNDVTRRLAEQGIAVDCLHGDLEQFHRDQVLAKFRNGSVRVLVATDVAGRGIDVKDLELVINYQLPDQPEIYLHRIGRTGRAGSQGVAVSLFTRRESGKMQAIEAMTGAPIERIAAPSSFRGEPKAHRAAFATLLISGGRKDKLRPGDILGALTGDAGLSGSDVGKIELHERITYVAVAVAKSKAAAKALNEGRIKKKRFRVSLV